MSEIASFLAGKAADWLPGFVLRRLFRPEKVAREIRVGLRGEKPIQPRTDDPFPQIDIWFEITNLSHLALTLDRLLFDLWFGQPTINGQILDLIRVPARTTSREIRYWSPLTPTQVNRIDDYLSNLGARGHISLSITAYFLSKVGTIKVEDRMERERP